MYVRGRQPGYSLFESNRTALCLGPSSITIFITVMVYSLASEMTCYTYRPTEAVYLSCVNGIRGFLEDQSITIKLSRNDKGRSVKMQIRHM